MNVLRGFHAILSYTLFFISTPFFWLSLDVRIFWAISASNVLNGVLSQIFYIFLEIYTQKLFTTHF